MGRVRLVLVAGALVLAAAACGTEPSSAPPAVAQNPAGDAPAPTAPVGANGQPITNLCDLLSDQDVSTILGIAAKAPTASGTSATGTTCAYGDQLTLTVTVLASPDAASSAVKDAVGKAKFSTRKDGVQGGVDESVYGTGPAAYGLTLRRQKLVVSILIPGPATDGEAKVVQLAGIVLSRANALGT